MQYSYIEKWKEITNSWSHCSSQELRTLSSQYETSRDSLYQYERSLQLFLEKLMDVSSFQLYLLEYRLLQFT